jgi:hypothetical protein
VAKKADWKSQTTSMKRKPRRSLVYLNARTHIP